LDNLIVVVNTRMDGSWQLSWQGWHDRSGTPDPRRWLTGVSRYRHSGPTNLTRFSTRASWRRGELDSLTLGRRRMAVVAGDSKAIWLASGVDAGKLRCSSNEDEGTKGGAVFGDPSGWLIWHGRRHTSAVASFTRCLGF
jgi:hypothetical protein